MVLLAHHEADIGDLRSHFAVGAELRRPLLGPRVLHHVALPERRDAATETLAAIQEVDLGEVVGDALGRGDAGQEVEAFHAATRTELSAFHRAVV